MLSNPAVLILLLEPPEPMTFLSLPTRPVVQSVAGPLQLNPATEKSLPPEVVRVTLGAVPVLVALLLPPTLVTPVYTRITRESLPLVPPVDVEVTV